jgi:hypothetical protein
MLEPKNARFVASGKVTLPHRGIHCGGGEKPFFRRWGVAV